MSSTDSAQVKKETQLGEKLFNILKICQKTNSERDLAALLDLITNEATKLMEADRATLFLLDRDRCELSSG
jgi:hypothetical protein